jgi:predicted enzyme related to lactoylglutathione lyase
MEIKLLVIRTNDAARLAAFYQLFGLIFAYHKHGNSPYHYSAQIGQMVLEIYPLAKEQPVPDKNLRLGFTINNFDETLAALTTHQVAFSTPVQTDFGFVTIITDPDGRKIELYKKEA